MKQQAHPFRWIMVAELLRARKINARGANGDAYPDLQPIEIRKSEWRA